MDKPPTRVFFDASVLVAAAHSPNGGSAMALQVCRLPSYRACVTELILLEARTNIAGKFNSADLVRFYQQLADASPIIVAPPSTELLARCAQVVAQKDAHVLAGAFVSNAAYLLTLDRRHLLTPAVLAAGVPFTVATPGDFLQAMADNKGSLPCRDSAASFGLL